MANAYIYQERECNKDYGLFTHFEALARKMRRPDEKLDNLDLKKFLNDEKRLQM